MSASLRFLKITNKTDLLNAETKNGQFFSFPAHICLFFLSLFHYLNIYKNFVDKASSMI